MKIPRHLKEEILLRQRALKLLSSDTPPDEKAKLAAEPQPRREHPDHTMKRITKLHRDQLASTATGDLETAGEQQAEAERLALGVLRRRTAFHHLDEPASVANELKETIQRCEEILGALQGREPKREKNPHQKALDAINQFCAENYRYPTRKEALALGLRREDLANLPQDLKSDGSRPVLKKVKRGRPSK